MRVRADDESLIHHSDKGSQYVSICYTERLADARITPSVGSVGDFYDNALAETIIGLYKAEIMLRRGMKRDMHGPRICRHKPYAFVWGVA